MRSYAYLTQFGHPYFKRAFAVSIVLHLALFGVAILAPLIPVLKGKRTFVRYAPAVRVDLVELPDELAHRLDKNLISTQDAIRALRERVKPTYLEHGKGQTLKMEKAAEAAIARLRALKDREGKLLDEKKETLRRGNILSEGVSAQVTEAHTQQLDAYRSILDQRIKLRWALPSYLRRQESLTGEIIIFLNQDGDIVRKKAFSSGNAEFDEYMNQAVDEALPFPAVPDEIQNDLRYEGVSIIFSAGELR